MRAVGWTLALLLVAAAGMWIAWSYLQADEIVREIAVRMPSEAEFDAMPLERSSEELKLAMNDCARVAQLEANPIARIFKGDEIGALRQHCDLIKARQEAMQGP